MQKPSPPDRRYRVMNAFKRGKEAKLKGEKADSCPYKTAATASAWFFGYDFAHGLPEAADPRHVMAYRLYSGLVDA